MAKTPKRRKSADENGDVAAAAPETPPQEENGVTSPPASRLRSHRKRTRSSADDSSVATTTDDDEPAAKRRSTRRRGGIRKLAAAAAQQSEDDEDDSMAAASTDNDEQSASSRRNKSTTTRRTRRKRIGPSEKNDDDDDESMTENSEGEENEGVAKKPRAQNNGYAIISNVAALPTVAEEETAATESSKPAALAPISKLRMPSKHTPGKLQTTALAPTRGERANVLEELPPTAAAVAGTTQQEQTQQEEVVVSPPGVGNVELNAILASQKDTPPPLPLPQQQRQDRHSWFQVVTTALCALVLTVSEVLTSLVVPQVEQLAEEEELQEVDVHVTKPLLTKSYVWFILFLFLQYPCFESIVYTLEETSNRSLDFFQGLFANEIPAKTEPTVVVLPSLSNDQVQELESLSTLLESMPHSTKFTEEMEFAKRQLIEIRGRLTEKGLALDDWQSGLNDVEVALENLIHTESMDDVPRFFFSANEILGFFQDMVPPTLTAQLLDTTYVFMWETASSTECRQPKDESNDDPILTKEMMQMGQDELRQMMLLSASEISSNDDVLANLRLWIREALPEPDTSRAPQEEETPTNGLSQDMARDVIRQVLETERADQLGVVDYASILAGASVIERATTPSLVDSLPLLNRLMKQARLRFYGYGPEAALTPTFPVNALGQCWAFERHSKREGGRYATLTVQLGQPVYVTKVVVEHAPKELTNEPETAIQQFRILGYEDADATDEPWNLGSFQYDIDAPRILQHFQVANHANGEPIPKLQSIALAIDSNWGSNYSCLYRFRVLGGDEPSEDVIEADVVDDGDDEYDADSEDVDAIVVAQQETKENVEVEVEPEDLDAEPDSSRDEDHAGDFLEGEPERVRADENGATGGSEPVEYEEIASDDATETNVAAERVRDDENAEETPESSLQNDNGDNADDSEETAQEDASGTEDTFDSENGRLAELETEDSHHANVDGDEQMENAEHHDTNEENVETHDNDHHEDVEDGEVHNWDNTDRDSGDDLGEHDSGDSASGDHVHSPEQDSEDDSRDSYYDSGDDSSDAEEHDSGDDSRDDEHGSGDDEGEEYHDEH